MKKNNKILYVDMDGVLVDFQSGINALSSENIKKYKNRYDEVPNIFSLMDPIKDAIFSFKLISKYFDTYILSTSPWDNPTALQDKQNWVKKYIGKEAKKRLIFSHHKNLNKGDFLIDDRTKRGADKFEGKHIHFGHHPFTNWLDVLEFLIDKIDDVNNKKEALEEMKASL
tara:strand:- start:3610 stop:4119 length:510 start_codon:yes stop_codon:yes gene_type:complete